MPKLCHNYHFPCTRHSVGMLVSYLLLGSMTPQTAVFLFPAMIVISGCGMLLLTVNLQVCSAWGQGGVAPNRLPNKQDKKPERQNRGGVLTFN